MSRHEVFQMLKEHHEKTGRVMAPEEMILAAGKDTEPAAIIDGVHIFNWHLDKKRGGAA